MIDSKSPGTPIAKCNECDSARVGEVERDPFDIIFTCFDCGFRWLEPNGPVARGFMAEDVEKNAAYETKLRILAWLELRGPATASEIATMSGLKTTQVSASVHRMYHAKGDKLIEVLKTVAVFPAGRANQFALTDPGHWWLGEARRRGYLKVPNEVAV